MTPPRISIIVPSFNQGRYIEETLRSVLEQNYPALELIVMDGGSADETTSVLQRYRDRISVLESQPDRGQSHAINKGLACMTGDLWAYLNSDDLLASGALDRIAELFEPRSVAWIGAVSTIFDGQGDHGHVAPEEPQTLNEVLTPWHRSVQHVFPCSNVSFMRRSVYDCIGGFDESFHYSMDMEFYTRALFNGFQLRRVPEMLGRWRWHAHSKTVRDGQTYRFLEEELRIASMYAARLPAPDSIELRRDIAEQNKWYVVRRALHENPHGSRRSRLRRLLGDAWACPSLLFFRPWLGAVKKQFMPV